MEPLKIILWNDDLDRLTEELYNCPQGARIDHQGIHDCCSDKLIDRASNGRWQSTASTGTFSDVTLISGASGV